jgi:hypothetical protein
MRSPCCLCVRVSPPTAESRNSGARRDLPMCLYRYPHYRCWATARFLDHSSINTKNCWTRLLCGWCHIKRKSVCLCVCMYIPPYRCLVNTFPRQRRIVRHVVFYAARFLSKENRWLVLIRYGVWRNMVYNTVCLLMNGLVHILFDS